MDHCRGFAGWKTLDLGRTNRMKNGARGSAGLPRAQMILLAAEQGRWRTRSRLGPQSERRHIQPVISSKSNQRLQSHAGCVAYRRRDHVERLINRLKQFRRIATRYEKRAANYIAMVHIAMLLLWL
jgi:transposase